MELVSQKHDNRRYVFEGEKLATRPEYSLIVDMIPSTSKVIDLGCGEGTLGYYLLHEKKCHVTGVEISPSGVEIAKKRGLDAYCASIDQGLPNFRNNEFDVAVCNATMQMVMFPERLLEEMKRISREQIISFPNFGSYKNRIHFLFKGRMPTPMLYGYKWYNTGHIHQFSLLDLKALLAELGMEITELHFTSRVAWKSLLIKLWPNLFGDILIVRTRSARVDRDLTSSSH